MKKGLTLAALALVFVASVAAAPGAGFYKHVLKGFSANVITLRVDKDGEEKYYSENMMYALKDKMRIDVDLSKTREDGKPAEKGGESQDGPPAGMGKCYMLIDGERKVSDMVFPDSKMYMEFGFGKKNKMDKSPRQGWLSQADMKYEDLGAEAVEGRACRKVKATWTNTALEEAREEAAYMWLAKDLDEFPVKVQPIDDEDEITTTTYTNIKFGSVKPEVVSLPAGFKKGSFMDMMKASFKNPNQKGGGEEEEKLEEGKDEPKEEKGDVGGFLGGMKKKIKK